MLAKGDMPLTRVDAICRALKIDFAELARRVADAQPLLKELSQAMMDASICGLGQAAPNPALTVMRYFPREVS